MQLPVTKRLRYEKKFHASELALAQVEAVIKTHPAHFREVYPPRVVNNVYFDTPVLSHYWAHVNGTARRSKLRLRWYGHQAGRIGRPALEIKSKDGQVGSKTVFPLDDLNPGVAVDPRRLPDALRAGRTSEAVQEQLSKMSPSLFNSYSRRYYCSADHHFRLTLDTRLAVRAWGARSFGPRERYEDRGLIIIELKFDTQAEDADFQIPRDWPFRLARMSKYVYGIQRLCGYDGPLL